MGDLAVKIAQSDPDVQEHVRAMRVGMDTLTKAAMAAERSVRDMAVENAKLRRAIAELESRP